MNKDIVVFLRKENLIKKLVKGRIWGEDTFVRITPLSAPFQTVHLANETITKKLTKVGKFASDIL